MVSGLRLVRCRSVIILVINKFDSRFADILFCNHLYDYRPNRTPLSPLTSINIRCFKTIPRKTAVVLRNNPVVSRKKCIIRSLIVEFVIKKIPLFGFRTVGKYFCMGPEAYFSKFCDLLRCLKSTLARIIFGFSLPAWCSVFRV